MFIWLFAIDACTKLLEISYFSMNSYLSLCWRWNYRYRKYVIFRGTIIWCVNLFLAYNIEQRWLLVITWRHWHVVLWFFHCKGLVTSPLLKQFSMRSIGIIGAILFSVPNVMMAFVRHVMEMAVIFFLQGIGLGLIFTICNINFNAYFVKKRSMVL